MYKLWWFVVVPALLVYALWQAATNAWGSPARRCLGAVASVLGPVLPSIVVAGVLFSDLLRPVASMLSPLIVVLMAATALVLLLRLRGKRRIHAEGLVEGIVTVFWVSLYLIIRKWSPAWTGQALAALYVFTLFALVPFMWRQSEG